MYKRQVYALAYGVNAGLLSEDDFMPVIIKGWKALTDAVDAVSYTHLDVYKRQVQKWCIGLSQTHLARLPVHAKS